MIMGVEARQDRKLGFLLNSFINPRKLGRMSGHAGVWLERDPDTVRGPDIAYFSAAKMPPAARTPAMPRWSLT